MKKIMNLNKRRFTVFPVLMVPLLVLFLNSAVAATAASSTSQKINPVLHISTVDSEVVPLAPSSSPVGGVPFCYSQSLGTILCYPASFLKTAYSFPPTNGPHSLTGTGATIVIVDAFGSPTLQNDLNIYDTTFGLPPTTVTILCGPTWTGSPSDECPVTTIGDLTTATNAEVCNAPSWAEETTLDVTQAHSLAPGAKIVLVVANDCFDSSIYTAELAVVSQLKYSGSIMSQSFGEPDDMVTCIALNATGTGCMTYDPSLLDLPNEVYQTAMQNHWTVIASSGDEGANEDAFVLGTLELTPSFPATNPLVLAAGGTEGNPYGGQYGPPPGPGGTFSCPANTNCNTGLVVINGGANGCTTSPRPGVPSSCYPVRYGGEGTWNEFTTFRWGTQSGGGMSSLYPRPFYQFATPPIVTTVLDKQILITGRTTPDVSFNSAVNGGVLAWLGFLNDTTGQICTGLPCPGDWAVFGGTSASSPAWAAIIALLVQANREPVGFINRAIYQLGTENLFAPSFKASFHQITTGDNSLADGEAANCGGFSAYYGLPVPPYDTSCDGFPATYGYNLATGWGSPNVANFINNMLPLVREP